MASRRSKAEQKYVMISVVSERYAIHPQTLRLYEREGLIKPARSAGNTRLYDEEAIRRLEIILTLTRELGVNLGRRGDPQHEGAHGQDAVRGRPPAGVRQAGGREEEQLGAREAPGRAAQQAALSPGPTQQQF